MEGKEILGQTWKWNHLKPEELTGDYFFDGDFMCSPGVISTLEADEIHALYSYIQEFVKKNNGVSYIQVFEHQTSGVELFFIDVTSKTEIESIKENYSYEYFNEFLNEFHYCTLLFPDEN